MVKTIQQIPPAKALINGIRSIGYSFSTSVADIIDNSLTAGGNEINIYSDPLDSTPYFEILDNGSGMNENELLNAMTFGSNRDNKIDSQLDLGRFGLGLKSASLSQCRELIVVSKLHNEVNGMSYDLDLIESTNDWKLIVLDEEQIQELPNIQKLYEYDSGTIVIWRKFDKLEKTAKNFDDTFRSTISEAKKHVELVFHRFYDDINIYFNNDRIERKDPFLEQSFPRTQRGRESIINMKNGIITVVPYVLPFYNTLSHEEKSLLGNPKSIYDEQGFYIYRNKRLILWGSWLRMTVRSELAKLARVRIDIPSSLDEEWELDVKKSTAKIPDKIKDQIRASLDDSISRSRRTNRYPGTKEQSVDNKVWNRIHIRDGEVKYEINKNNPILTILESSLNNEQKNLLKQFIEELESYIPKYSIRTDSYDDTKILNDDETSDEDKKNKLKEIFKSIPKEDREMYLTTILNSEAYMELLPKYKEILEEMNKNE